MTLLLCALLLNAAIAGMPSSSLEEPITFLGEFSNIRASGEHAYGQSVLLWRQGAQVFGFFESAQGLMGDTPAGLLDNVKFDAQTGALSFTAKLTTGQVSTAAGKWVPSRDLFEFQGTLHKSLLSGRLRHMDQLSAGAQPEVRDVKLRLIPSSVDQRFKSFAEWQEMAREVLKRRGPKW